ncbi:MAG TPA: ABC transporter ATP-binding protein [Acidimicrobiia bacterium]|nr:ABC transporter ATP-binding protein [Acidimicrobiia bacterium]
MAAAIEVRSISKQFKLYHEHYTSLKERVINYGRIPYEPFMALEDVDFDVEAGSTVGILGHNGCGKSTLLKCVAGILQPTRGEIVTRGRVAALLELGAGFNHELTGRENVFMNASILGLSKKDTELIFDEIVAFSELERFIDMQVRHYSSGMYVRLGFAVAVNVEPDILLVDEVLSVGDEAFQRKCIERVKKFQEEGRTILFVTHAADLVRRICDRAIVLDHGKMVIDAAPGEAVRVFRESLHGGELNETADAAVVEEPVDDAASSTEREVTYRVRITDAEIDHPGRFLDREWLLPDEAMSVRIKYHATERTSDILFGIAIHDENGNHLFGTNTSILGVDVPPAVGDGEMAFEFPRVPLLDGTYFVTIAVQTVDEGTVYDWWEQHLKFSVMNPARTQGLVSFPIDVKFGETGA